MPPSSSLNILYIMTDQQRYDSLSCVGRSLCQTPAVDRLARAGMRFDNAYSVCALCSPARISMLTGRYPHNHRMWNNNDMMQWARSDLPDEERLISQDLVEAGYHCGFSGKWHGGSRKVPSSYGFLGMDVPNYGDPYKTREYAEYIAARGLQPPVRLKSELPWAAGTLRGPMEACEPHFVAEHALNLMHRFSEERERTGRPFLMFVSFWGPHHPCFVPEPYASMYDPADVQLPPNLEDNLVNKPAVQRRFRRSFYPQGPALSEDQWRWIIAKYWGFCSFCDDEIGRLLQALKEMGRENDTAVIFTTDHGDMQGAHGGIFDKGEFMYEETYHIPLIIRVPGITTPGDVCDKLVSNMDLASTALALAGVSVPANHDGRSLVPLLHDPNADWRDDLMCEFHGHRYLYSQRMVRWSNYKYVYNASDEDELYDLDRDPYELRNVVNEPEYTTIADEGRRRLLRWIDESRDPLKFAAHYHLASNTAADR